MSRQGKKIVEYIFLILLACLFIFPLLWMIVSSMKPESHIYLDMNSIKAFLPSMDPSQWFITYKELFSRFDILQYVFNSVTYAVVITGGSIVVNAMAGYAFAKFEFSGKKFLFALLLVLLIVPLETIIITQFTVAHTLGILNTRLAVVLPMIANMFFIYLFRNFFKAVPDEVIESVKLDGANYWTIFWRIMLPMSKPAIATVGTLSFIASWNDYLWPLMVLTDTSMFPLQVAITNINTTQPVYTNQVMAILTISTIPLIIVYIVAQKYILQGLGGSGTGIK
ncbi:carbohydrate ABC transporter permease [Salipaludibacillus agaradhaerens]|jgi:fructooligosaccharide transport system permease protein|uniref:Carbohydrate ABC transporter permease n=1 Tax=Salipaludibacillus agaradhaerens TaxID=76935 RepID=A0A9Q4B495_SALAG|nr:carbohydrate ABC transporter permease [Salipaludibacillus agaradhaerens]MCR6097737.1 carbohydrate ABC transporter permease [Salipaludibacillus agaradhaerens]MCR6105408.1 carbohydrate ABC transporter permease [Salipaludibacillus agaradhaerens]MCR6112779.1 carbohydrate ABC transporter permease [Salipaludibacillus agaradhaerens]MCR6117447.1 carbohydrate ABC transporter permease [Salipaludibacillus agaradhaerens]